MQVHAPRFSGVRLTEIYAPNDKLLYRCLGVTPQGHPVLAEDEVQLDQIVLNGSGSQKTSLGHYPLAKQLTDFLTAAVPTTRPEVSLPESFKTNLKELIGQLQAKGGLTREQADAYSESADKSALALALAMQAGDAQDQTVWSLI